MRRIAARLQFMRPKDNMNSAEPVSQSASATYEKNKQVLANNKLHETIASK